MGPPSGPFSYRESEFLYDPRGIGFMELISGNEAIARGAWEAGATIGVAYPGTPSTETMETFAKQPAYMPNGARMRKSPWKLAWAHAPLAAACSRA